MHEPFLLIRISCSALAHSHLPPLFYSTTKHLPMLALYRRRTHVSNLTPPRIISWLNPVARMKKIVRCTFEAAQCYAPTVISPDDLLAVGPSTPLDSNDQLYNLRSMTMSTRPCFPMLDCTAILVHYSSLGCPTLRLSAVPLLNYPRASTVRSPTPVGQIKPSHPYLDYLLRCQALARVFSRSHSIYLSAQAPTPAENASPAFPDIPSRLN